MTANQYMTVDVSHLCCSSLRLFFVWWAFYSFPVCSQISLLSFSSSPHLQSWRRHRLGGVHVVASELAFVAHFHRPILYGAAKGKV